MPVLAPTSKFELNPAAVAPAIVAVRQSASRICDQLRCAATRLLAMNPDGRPQALAITSSLRHEGKSTFCANLGLLLAEGGHRRVVVVDGDLRNGSLAALLGAAKGPGLADLLADAASLHEVVQASSRPNFFVVGAGQSDSRSSSELLSGPRLARAIADLRARADYVLFDAPSVLDRADGNLIARHCDGAVLVIAGNRTPEPSVMDAVESLRGHGAKILGCVLNGVRNRNRRAQPVRKMSASICSPTATRRAGRSGRNSSRPMPTRPFSTSPPGATPFGGSSDTLRKLCSPESAES
ncbi:MAG: CpsD/CapB family tyrosine-protein kinase [Planctomycetes bacterium]|nr:CpsD/CapB family tyrosine-protein kinase [Planctomycetota bacterium]